MLLISSCLRQLGTHKMPVVFLMHACTVMQCYMRVIECNSSSASVECKIDLCILFCFCRIGPSMWHGKAMHQRRRSSLSWHPFQRR